MITCWSKAQFIAYRSVCGITGSISTIGSSLIIFMISRSRTKLTRVQNRLLLPMCIFDILGSIAQALSTLPIDTEQITTPCAYDRIVTMGNHATCTAQGLFYQLGMTVPGYNAALCVYYAMVIKWNKTDEEMKRVELYLHALVLVPNFIMVAIALSNDLYGNMGVICFLTNKHEEAALDGIRERKHVFIVAITIIAYLIALIVITTIIYSLVAVYSSVKEQERRMSVYMFERPGAPRQKSKMASTTEDTKIQAYLYVLGFFVTYIFPFICFALYQIFYHDGVAFPVVFLQGVFGPLQGFWNFLIFIRPRFKFMTKDHPDESFWRRLRMTVLAKGRDNHGNGDGRRNRSKMQKLQSKYHNQSLHSTSPSSQSRNLGESSPKSNFLGSSHFPLKLTNELIPCVEESSSYHSDTSHPVGPPIDSSDTVSIPQGIDDDDDNYNKTLGPLSMLVAQDLLGSNILPRTGRRRSMIDFRISALDRNEGENSKGAEIPDIDYKEEDGERNSGMLDSFYDTKLVTGSSQQQRRKSCPSLAFTWKEDVETEADRRAYKELDDILLETSIQIPDHLM